MALIARIGSIFALNWVRASSSTTMVIVARTSDDGARCMREQLARLSRRNTIGCAQPGAPSKLRWGYAPAPQPSLLRLEANPPG